jgi:hypothetical protein
MPKMPLAPIQTRVSTDGLKHLCLNRAFNQIHHDSFEKTPKMAVMVVVLAMIAKRQMIVGHRMRGACSVHWHKSGYVAEIGKMPSCQVSFIPPFCDQNFFQNVREGRERIKGDQQLAQSMASYCAMALKGMRRRRMKTMRIRFAPKVLLVSEVRCNLTKVSPDSQTQFVAQNYKQISLLIFHHFTICNESWKLHIRAWLNP